MYSSDASEVLEFKIVTTIGNGDGVLSIVNSPELADRLRQKLVPSGSVIDRAIQSGVWEGGINTLNRVIQLAKLAILAQLLPPEDFGLLGVGFLTLAVFESFSQFGIDPALIQRKEKNVDPYLDTSWILKIARGIILTSTIFLVAPYAASWFGEPRATNVIRVLGVGPLLLGLKNPAVMYFTKNLQFHLRFMQQLSGTIVNFLIAVTLGVLLGNVWALVAGSVAGNVISLVVSYLLHDYRPRPRFELDLARELADFGKWMFGGSITLFLKRQGDDVFVGWFFGASPLAFYQMAYRFSNAPASELTDVINNVTFPSFSQVQDDYRKLRNGYFRTVRFTLFLSLPAAVGIALVAPSFVRVFLGTNWLPTVPLMRALAICGALRALNRTNVSVLNALSRPDLGFKLSVVRVVLIAIGIYPAADRFGLAGIAGVIVVTAAIVNPVWTYITLRAIEGSVVRYVQTLVPPVGGCAVMAGVLFMLSEAVSIESPIVKLVLFVVSGTLTYGAYLIVSIVVFDCRIGDDINAVLNSFK